MAKVISRAGLRYAGAFFSLSKNQIEVAKKRRDILNELDTLFSDPSLRRVLVSPVIPIDLKAQVFEYVMAKTDGDDETKKFISTLVEASRAGILPDVARAYTRLVAEAEGVLFAEVETAVALDDSEKQKLEFTMSKVFGKQVKSELSTNKELLGGMIIRAGNYVVDMSVRSKLDQLAQAAIHAS